MSLCCCPAVVVVVVLVACLVFYCIWFLCCLILLTQSQSLSRRAAPYVPRVQVKTQSDSHLLCSAPISGLSVSMLGNAYPGKWPLLNLSPKMQCVVVVVAIIIRNECILLFVLFYLMNTYRIIIAMLF